MGTRPEIIKQAPVVWAAEAHSNVQPIVCHSGQHTDLAQPMLDYFGLRPDVHLELMRSHSRLTSLVGGCLQRLDETLHEVQPDAIVVQGDTATSAATAMAGFYSQIPVVHVEAGLRTGDIRSPWPEEMNRRIATLSCDLHCAPTPRARQRLIEESVPAHQIVISGNPVVNALQWTLEREQSAIRQAEQSPPQVILTAHRRENFGAPLEAICSAVLALSEKFTDTRFLFVTHPNPQAGPVVRSILEGNSRIELAPPMSYPQFVTQMKASRLIISDSGGVQEEAPTLQVPLLITRESTERPEVVECGAGELVGTDRDLLIRRATELLTDSDARQSMIVAENPFGDGSSGHRIVEQIVARFG